MSRALAMPLPPLGAGMAAIASAINWRIDFAAESLASGCKSICESVMVTANVPTLSLANNRLLLPLSRAMRHVSSPSTTPTLLASVSCAPWLTAGLASSVPTSNRCTSPFATFKVSSRSPSSAGTLGLPVTRSAALLKPCVIDTAAASVVERRNAPSNCSSCATLPSAAAIPCTEVVSTPETVMVTVLPARVAVTPAPRMSSSSTLFSVPRVMPSSLTERCSVAAPGTVTVNTLPAAWTDTPSPLNASVSALPAKRAPSLTGSPGSRTRPGLPSVSAKVKSRSDTATDSR